MSQLFLVKDKWIDEGFTEYGGFRCVDIPGGTYLAMPGCKIIGTIHDNPDLLTTE
jgi:hypothetical protein